MKGDPQSPLLRVEDLSITVIRKPMKTLRLRVCAPDGAVRLSAPRRVSDDVLKAFVRSKLPWIRAHQAKIRARPPALAWQPLDAATKRRYRAQLLEQLPSMIAHYEQALGVKAKHITLRHMKSRWGTCNTRSHRITFNLELARHSTAALEYVVAHELAHLRVAGHNKKFYGLLDAVMPDWRERRRELREGLGL